MPFNSKEVNAHRTGLTMVHCLTVCPLVFVMGQDKGRAFTTVGCLLQQKLEQENSAGQGGYKL